jgi:uncharacterized membrane protein
MSDQEFNNTPSGHESNQQPATEPAWGAPPPNYTQAAYPPPPPPNYIPPTAAGAGLSDTAASALAYVTFIPAVIFLVLAPYNEKPVIKFHAIQELGLTVIGLCLHLIFVFVPVLGWPIWAVGWIALLVVWVICTVKASQGSALKLPLIGNFAAEHSGYRI